MLYTSSLDSKYKYWDKNAITIIPSTRTKIHSYNNIHQLAPHLKAESDFRSGKISENEYKRRYLSKIDALPKNSFYRLLAEVDVVLCSCHDHEYCHRHILSEYIKNNYGVDIKEL